MGLTATTSGARPRSRAVRVKGRGALILAATIPTIIVFSVFLLFPLLYGFTMSLTNWNPVSVRMPLKFVALRNYQQIFAAKLTYTCLWNTIYFTLMYVPTVLIFGLLLAVLIDGVNRGKGIYRTVYYLPVLTPMVAAGIVFRWLFDPRFGLPNQVLLLVLNRLGIQGTMPTYLRDPRTAMACVAVMAIWKGIGYDIVLFLAGLQSIPRVFYEAAMVDGATRWQTFLKITVPMLRPTIFFAAATGTIWAMQSYVPQYIMSHWTHQEESAGGPVNSTRTIVFLLFDEAWINSRFGYACALGVVLFVAIMTLTIWQRKMLATEWSL